MSPRTSQERERTAAADLGTKKTNAEAFAPPADDSDGPTPLALYLAAIAGFAATAIYAGLKFGAPGVVLVLVGASLVGVIAAFWSSLRALIGETKLSGADAFALGAPRAEEEQKRAVLRALKDLEFERSVGKISEDDYRVLVAQYRAEAKKLLRQIDKGSEDQRARAALLVGSYLETQGIALSSPSARDSEAPESEDGEDAAKTTSGSDEAAESTSASLAGDVASGGDEDAGDEEAGDEEAGDEEADEDADASADTAAADQAREDEPEEEAPRDDARKKKETGDA